MSDASERERKREREKERVRERGRERERERERERLLKQIKTASDIIQMSRVITRQIY